MEMNINEKKALYAFGCPVLKATVERLRMLAAITPDPGTKKLFYKLAIKLLDEGVENWYRCFFYNLRIEMENYFNAQLIMSLAEVSTIEVRATIMKLTKYEKETIVLFNESDDEASIQTYNAGLRKRLAVFSKKHPDLCRLEKSMEQGGVSYLIDKSRLSIRFQPPMSEERRQKASELAKQNGFNSQPE